MGSDVCYKTSRTVKIRGASPLLFIKGGNMNIFKFIKQLDIEEFAKFMVEECAWDCNNCSEHEELSDNPLSKDERCDEKCVQHCVEWLKNDAKFYEKLYKRYNLCENEIFVLTKDNKADNI